MRIFSRFGRIAVLGIQMLKLVPKPLIQVQFLVGTPLQNTPISLGFLDVQGFREDLDPWCFPPIFLQPEVKEILIEMMPVLVGHPATDVPAPALVGAVEFRVDGRLRMTVVCFVGRASKRMLFL